MGKSRAIQKGRGESERPGKGTKNDRLPGEEEGAVWESKLKWRRAFPAGDTAAAVEGGDGSGGIGPHGVVLLGVRGQGSSQRQRQRQQLVRGVEAAEPRGPASSVENFQVSASKGREGSHCMLQAT